MPTTWQILAPGPAAAVAQALEADLVARGYAARRDAARRATRRDTASDGRCASIDLAIDPSAGMQPQAYRLTVAPNGISVVARDAAGLFHGTRTLLQLLGWRAHDDAPMTLPGCVIDDAPSFAHRGFMLDVSRDKVPTLPTLFALVDLLAGFKMNQLQLYVEHTFAYRGHDEVWAEASPLTPDDVQKLDAYCRARFIELVPNQNSFGHMHRWLKHPRYRDLAECPDGFEHPWNPGGEPYGLCASDPRSLALLADLYDQLLPCFSSRQVNVGLDETLDLGAGRSRELCAREGAPRVYLCFLREVHRLVSERGHVMQFWADIVVHHPELVDELPRDAVALVWGYEAAHPFAEQAALFARSGLPFYVCPGTSSWNALAGRAQNALGNLRAAAEAGVAAGAAGYLVTDWGDNGHLQPLPVSYLGAVAGAGLAWNAALGDDLEEATVRSLDAHVFRDAAGVMGGVLRDLGNAYLHAGALPGNASALFGVLVHPERELLAGISATSLARVDEVVRAAAAPLDRAVMHCADAALVLNEVAWVRDALLCAVGLGAMRAAGGPPSEQLADELRHLMGEHRRNWLARNRPGGLVDSEARLMRALAWVVRGDRHRGTSV